GKADLTREVDDLCACGGRSFCHAFDLLAGNPDHYVLAWGITPAVVQRAATQIRDFWRCLRGRSLRKSCCGETEDGGRNERFHGPALYPDGLRNAAFMRCQCCGGRGHCRIFTACATSWYSGELRTLSFTFR